MNIELKQFVFPSLKYWLPEPVDYSTRAITNVLPGFINTAKILKGTETSNSVWCYLHELTNGKSVNIQFEDLVKVDVAPMSSDVLRRAFQGVWTRTVGVEYCDTTTRPPF